MLKTNLKNKATLVTLLACSALILQACNRSNSNNETGTGLDLPDSSNGTLALNVTDARGIPIDQATIMVINDATTGDSVVDTNETQLSTQGRAQLRLNAFSGERRIRLEVERLGFLSNGGSYSIIAGQDNNVDIVLSSNSVSSDGIEIASAAGNLSTGDLMAEAIDDDGTNALVTRVLVRQNTTVRSADGTELNDFLTLTVAHFDSADAQALTAFPGGFDVSVDNVEDINVLSNEGTMPDANGSIVFQSAGFTAIEMFDSNGVKADKFEGTGIEITMDIPPQTINPETGNLIAVGDIIPVWSFDTDTASWEFEGSAPAQDDGNGGLEVSYFADHLSYWNLDYYYTETCAPDINLEVTEGDRVAIDPLLQVQLMATDSSQGWASTGFNSGSGFSFGRVPTTLDVALIFNTPNLVSPPVVTRNNQPYNGESFRLCGATNNFDVRLPAIEVADVIIEVTGVCANNNVRELIEDAAVSYVPNTFSKTYDSRTDANGRAVFRDVPVGAEGTAYVSNFDDGITVGAATPGSISNILIEKQNCVVSTGLVGQ